MPSPPITRPDDLDAFLSRARAAPSVALDTEFVWERTFFARLGLVQAGLSETETYLIDAPALDDLSGLGALLADPAVEIVLHDAVQDLTILGRATGARPRNVFDTRLAAGFAGLPSTLSLRRLLEETVGVSLAKTESRSDWLRRPLSDAQVAYAHDDVRYLVRAADVLKARIEAAGRTAWLREELDALDAPELYDERDADEAYLRVKGQARLSPKERAVLRALAAWREAQAQADDLPRGHVVTDDALVMAAQRRPATADAAERLGAIPRRYAPRVAEAVAEGMAAAPIRLPDLPVEDETLGARVDLMLAYVKGRGLAEGVDPALVANRADVIGLATSGPEAEPDAHRLLRGWRRVFIGDELLELLSGTLSIRLDPATGLPERA